MQFLISHWHCILPMIGIIAAFLLIREKLKSEGKSDSLDQLKDISADGNK